MSQTRLLYDLQQVDQEMGDIARRQKKISANLRESDELKQARQQVQDADERLAKCRVLTRDLDLEVAGLHQRIETNEQRLYSGRVSNPKELGNLQEETASIKRWREKKEEDLLAAMVDCDEAESDQAQAQADLGEISQRWGIEQEKLSDEQARLQTQQDELREHRASLVGSISSEDFETYQNLRKRKGGRAVAAMKDGICEGCGISTPSKLAQQARSSTDLAFCSNCGRIIHVI